MYRDLILSKKVINDQEFIREFGIFDDGDSAKQYPR
jgi:hypothetical protein